MMESRAGTRFGQAARKRPFQSFYTIAQTPAKGRLARGPGRAYIEERRIRGSGIEGEFFRMLTAHREPDLMASPRNGGDGTSTVVATKPKAKTKKPSLYRVLLLNDDYTPMEFVIHVLERFFNKNREDATRIMLHVHHNGVGECGIFTYEVAETKVTQVMDFARRHQHPLQCVMEKK